MNQKRAALLATALTAFLLVVVGGVAGGMAAHRADPAASVPATAGVPPATLGPAIKDPVTAPDRAQQAVSPAGEWSARGEGGWPGEREHRDDHDDEDDD